LNVGLEILTGAQPYGRLEHIFLSHTTPQDPFARRWSSNGVFWRD
jgi:hypothetical protein